MNDKERIEQLINELEWAHHLRGATAPDSNLDITEYRKAPCRGSELHGAWDNKPDRLLYDLCDEVERLRRTQRRDRDVIEDLMTLRKETARTIQALKWALSDVVYQLSPLYDPSLIPDADDIRIREALKAAKEALGK